MRDAFRELHGSRLHGFAQLLVLGDRHAAAKLASDALADGAARVDELRHPERAAAWLRRRVVERARVRRGDPVDAAVMLDSSRSYVEYDLGKVTPISGAYLQGDNNDDYTVSVSEDGQSFKRLWVAAPVNEKGLRQRYSNKLSGSARYVRLSASGGDGWAATLTAPAGVGPTRAFPSTITPMSRSARTKAPVVNVAGSGTTSE